jgi:hypothetical protein
MHQEVYPVNRRIGPHADADLCSVIKGKWVQLHPLITPNNLVPLALRRGAFKMVISLQARAMEASSLIKRIEISWDGRWEEGEAEMAKHFIIRELN